MKNAHARYIRIGEQSLPLGMNGQKIVIKAQMRKVSNSNFYLSLLVAVFCGMQVKHSLCKASRTLNSHEETYNYLND